MLIDTGATKCFIDDEFCRDLGVRIDTCDAVPLCLANGAKATSLGACNIHVTIGSLDMIIRCQVLHMAPTHDMILGDPWCRAYKADLDFGLQRCRVTNPADKSTHSLQLHGTSDDHPQATPTNVICNLVALKDFTKGLDGHTPVWGVRLHGLMPDDDNDFADLPDLG